MRDAEDAEILCPRYETDAEACGGEGGGSRWGEKGGDVLNYLRG